MAKETLLGAAPQGIGGAVFLATITEGWTARLQREGYILLAHPEHPPRIVELASVKEGDILPRDTDEAFEFPPRVEGH